MSRRLLFHRTPEGAVWSCRLADWVHRHLCRPRRSGNSPPSTSTPQSRATVAALAPRPIPGDRKASSFPILPVASLAGRRCRSTIPATGATGTETMEAPNRSALISPSTEVRKFKKIKKTTEKWWEFSNIFKKAKNWQQSNNQLVNQSIKQSIKQSIDRSISQSVKEAIDQSISESINQSIDHPNVASTRVNWMYKK